MNVPDGVEVKRSRLITSLAGWLSGMDGPAAAVTLGSTIVLRPGVELTPRLLRHELAHVGQWSRHPVSFPFRYIAHHIRYGYHENPYEIEARAAEDPAQQRAPWR